MYLLFLNSNAKELGHVIQGWAAQALLWFQ